MNLETTVRLRAYASAGVVGLAAALAIGEPAPALLAVPLLALVVAGLVGSAAPELDVAIEDAPTSIVEGEERMVRLRLTSSEAIRNLNLGIGLPSGLGLSQFEGGEILDSTTLNLDIERGETIVEFTVKAEGWGRRTLGPIVAYVDGPLRMLTARKEFPRTIRMVSIPSDDLIRELLMPRETNLHSGDLVSKLRGSGSEFAELRPFQMGDDPRSLNWRVSSRMGSWWVNERHPERNGDVVLVVDAQTQEGGGTEALVDKAVRLAGALIREYGRRRYRIGLVTVDGVARWIQPGSGESHRRRILDQLLGVEEGESSRAAIERAVLRVAVKPAFVIILTPMLDDSLAGIAHSLRVSGLDIALVEVDPVMFLPPPTNPPRQVGRRVWTMERDRLRDRLAGDGIPVAPWRVGDAPDVPLSQIANWRASWRLPV